MKKNNVRLIVFSFLILIITMVVTLFIGNGSVSGKDIVEVLLGKGTSAQNTIVFNLRIPRIIAAASTGAALSVSGFLLQNTLNNTLCSPGMLGINNGAGLGVLIFACLLPYHYGGKCIAAFIGALTVTGIIYFLSIGTGMSKTSIVLSGVAISALCLSFIDIIIALKPETVADRVAFQLGSFARLTVSSVQIGVILIIITLVVAIASAPSLDVIILGDDVATGLGVNIRLYRTLQIISASVLAGAAVSMCGIIGFMGLIVPNVIRLVYKGRSRGAIAMCISVGGIFLLICDTIGRTVVYPYELPCGLFLNIIGAPFLVWLLIKKRKRLGVND